MKVAYKYTNKINEGIIVYKKNENSFDFISEKNGDISLLINYLQLNIDSLTNQLVSVWGFHPYQSWVDTTLNVPEFNKGIVKIENNYESGLSYREEDMNGWQTFYDNSNGWICIGERNAEGLSIMFATNVCVVISGDKIKSLWMKPKFE